MKRSIAAAVTALAALATPTSAQAQEQGGFALNQFQPSPAGDVFFGVPSPFASGHLKLRGYLGFDYANEPVRDSVSDTAVVKGQAFLRGNASLALWDRLLVSVDIPFAVAQSTDDPGLPGTTFTQLDGGHIGDIRLGARGRLLGEERSAFQLGLGSYVFFPSGNESQYAGQGAMRGALHAVIGGRIEGDEILGFAWSASAGPELRGGDSPSALVYGAAAGVLLGDGVVQLGPELHGSTMMGSDVILSTVATPAGAPLATAAGTSIELLLGGKVRLAEGFTLGAGIGPGIASGVGTPTVRALGLIGWAPLAGKGGDKPVGPAEVGDQDKDGIKDDIDACPDVPGQPSPDPSQDGCPPQDRDGDGVSDIDDACPNTKGVRSNDVTVNGCPEDSDGDGQHDGIDACPKEVGVAHDDPKKNGCPGDRDGDGIIDKNDKCPKQVGPASLMGCPEDPDGDGIKHPDDACPQQRGLPDPDPKQHGCPKFIRVTRDEIILKQQVQFKTDGKTLGEAVAKDSDALLTEVKDAIMGDANIELVEVQGHTDHEADESYNMELSQKRAASVRQYLIDKGVPADKMVAKGYGFNRPIADNRIRTGRQKNRRVQFVIVKRKK
jgi:outer membrane protein OmpA-like peptidoglycan-associated protein